MTKWDPGSYEEFMEERLRPGLDLINRIEHPAPAHIADLGCGTGRLTAALAGRWPDASVVGVDRSPEMIAAAPGANVTFELGDIETWSPARPVDVVFANASLHWIEDHATLFPRLIALLSPGGVLAVQMPLSWDQPSHRALREAALEFGVEIDAPPTQEPQDYLEMLAGEPLTRRELWVTTYYHVLTGETPVLRWVAATGMKRFLSRLEPGDEPRYRAEAARRITAAYPPDADGATVFPFTRLFILVQAG